MTKKTKRIELPYIKVYSISPALKEELYAIAKNTSTDLSSLIKPKLRELANSYPVEMRRYTKD